MNFLNTFWVAKALGSPSPTQNVVIFQITSDTREITKGALFVALKGENADGHQFIEKAVAAGAIAVLHQKGHPLPDGVISFSVENTLTAWRKLSKAWRKEFRGPVVAIAGSAGKTTSKELMAALLRGKFQNVLFTQASQNGFQGVPTTLLRLRPDHDAAVIEVGIDEPGSMIQHLELVAPDAGLLTSIGPEHLEKLISLDNVEYEEGLLFKILEERHGFAAINLDDERIARQGRQIKSARNLTYSLKTNANVRGHLTPREEKSTLVVEGLSSSHATFEVPLEGTHNALNLLGALTLAQGLGLTVEEMQRGLKTFTPPPGRSEVHEWRGCKVLADTYNANPASVEAALDTLFGSKASKGETWVCLGDMLELGTLEEALHRGLADPILSHHVKHVFLYGPRMKMLEDELKRRGFQGSLAHFSSQEEMAEKLRASCKAGDKILLKGSRGMRMENVWKAMRD